MNFKERKDPLTGELFITKRNNQRFASRKNQVRYNNIKAQKMRNIKSPYNRAIDKNLKVLMDILGDKSQCEKSKDYLIGAGFDFRFFNRSLINNDVNYQCVYHYALCKTEKGMFKILNFK